MNPDYIPLAEGEEQPWETVNQNQAEARNNVFAHNSLTSSGLTVGYQGGTLDGNTVAAGTLSSGTDNTTNYVVVNRSTRAASALLKPRSSPRRAPTETTWATRPSLPVVNTRQCTCPPALRQ